MACDLWRSKDRLRSTLMSCFAVLLCLLSLFTRCSNARHIPSIERRKIANGVDLRILPIGDSITFGAPSEPYNGYRRELRVLLTNAGNEVDFVGGTQSGTFDDNQHEGHRGKIIDEIRTMSDVGIYANPNVVLLHAGTNDINRDIDSSTAPARLSNLIAYIYQHAPNALILVAQIVPSKPDGTFNRDKIYNAAIPGVVNDWVKRGKHVVTVDMFSDFDRNTDLADDLHPNALGYTKMAQKWYNAIVSADEGWIQKAGDPKQPPPQQCEKLPVWTGPVEIATGPHIAHSDAAFVQEWAKIGTFSTHACNPRRLFFADLDGDGFKDWACVGEKADVLAFLQIPYEGVPTNNWKPLGTIATGGDGSRNGSEIFFADVDGDGKDDYVYVHNGAVNVWINGGPQGSGWLWNNIGKVNGNDVGATRENLQMVDIDGDGRADFLIVDPNSGTVTAWLNGGPATLPQYYKIGIIATGQSKTVNDVVILGDFTGNGLADYMLVGKNGKVTGLANFIQERAFVPSWQSKVTIAEGPDGATQQYVRLVDLNGDGKVEYVLLDKDGGSEIWFDKGTGGKWQVGDGVFLADLDADGVEDYIWMDGSGAAFGYLNIGRGADQWDNKGQILASQGPLDLRHVRWAPLTSSRRADVIILDPAEGACTWAENLGQQAGGEYKFSDFSVLATGPRHSVVAAPYNWHWDYRRVQFADLTGDGLADYLYINTNGAVIMWKNMGIDPPGTWGPPQLVADGPRTGVWWTEIQFADTDNDGKVDYIAVDRITGRTQVWRNLGFKDDGSIKWDAQFDFATGPDSQPAGCNIRIAEMTGDGRADYVSVDPMTGGLTLWHNGCRALPSSDPAPPPPPPNDPGDGSEDDDDTSDEGAPMCDYTRTFASLNDVDSADMTVMCKLVATMQVESDMLNKALSDYNDVNNGYDKKFGYYVKYIKKLVPTQLEECMAWEGGACNQYFTCHYEAAGTDVTGKCPLNLTPREESIFTLTYTLDDENGFFNEIATRYGIDKSWVKWGDEVTQRSCSGSSPDNDCEPVVQSLMNYPQAADDFDVTNPKDVITTALPGIQGMQLQMTATQIEMKLGLWSGSYEDVVQVYSVPVFMLAQAVDSMAQVKDIGEQEQESEEKNLILLIVSAVLFFVPFVGEAGLALAGFTTMSRVIGMLGELANGALTVYDIVQDPKSAPLAIIGGLLGLAGPTIPRTPKGLGDLAKIRRGMKASDFGDLFKKNDDVLQKIIGACKRR